MNQNITELEGNKLAEYRAGSYSDILGLFIEIRQYAEIIHLGAINVTKTKRGNF